MSTQVTTPKRPSRKTAGSFSVASLSTEAAIKRHIDLGYGVGEGKDYKPWIGIHHFSSSGKSTRCQGWHTGRTHTFFSDPEYHFFLLLEWDDQIKDIQEQYPLFPQTEINEICEALAINVPKLVGTSESMTRTTDFLVTTLTGKEAWAVKPSAQLESRRTVEKLEIERIYWERRGIPFAVVAEREIPKVITKNIKWIHGNRMFDGDRSEINTVRGFLETKVHEEPIGKLCREGDDLLGLPHGKCMETIKHLLATKAWRVDMNEEVSPSKTLKIL
jgi:hypothetical protein